MLDSDEIDGAGDTVREVSADALSGGLSTGEGV